jgi:hypothetical protein
MKVNSAKTLLLLIVISILSIGLVSGSCDLERLVRVFFVENNSLTNQSQLAIDCAVTPVSELRTAKDAATEHFKNRKNVSSEELADYILNVCHYPGRLWLARHNRQFIVTTDGKSGWLENDSTLVAPVSDVVDGQNVVKVDDIKFRPDKNPRVVKMENEGWIMGNELNIRYKTNVTSLVEMFGNVSMAEKSWLH